MKLVLGMKHADAVDNLIAECLDAVDSDEDHPDFIALLALIKTHIKYSEYIRVEFDTEAGTVKVLEQ